MSQYDKKAAELLSVTRESEAEKAHDYETAHVRRSVVHSREDLILAVSYLSSMNEQLVWVRRFLAVIAVLLLAIFVRG